MILSDWQIQYHAERDAIVEPFDIALLNPASIDVLLGKNLLIEVDAGEFKPVDLSPFSKKNLFCWSLAHFA